MDFLHSVINWTHELLIAVGRLFSNSLYFNWTATSTAFLHFICRYWPSKSVQEIEESASDILIFCPSFLRSYLLNGDRVLLRVSPWKGVVRFGKRGKLAPRFVGPFEIVERIGPVAYRLRLPQELSCIHDVFHVSNLKKCLAESDIQIPLEEIRVNDKVYFIEEPVEIVDRQIKKLKRSWIPIVKVRWDSRRGAEFTWEREDQFKAKYPHLFMLIHHSSPVEL
ncbi:hypothetical protein Tco_0511728 [Tanacetum coccineum]